jgi:hypothetical protein
VAAGIAGPVSPYDLALELLAIPLLDGLDARRAFEGSGELVEVLTQKDQPLVVGQRLEQGPNFVHQWLILDDRQNDRNIAYCRRRI